MHTFKTKKITSSSSVMGSAVSCLTYKENSGLAIYNDAIVKRLFPRINDLASFTEYIRYVNTNNHIVAIRKKLIINDFMDEHNETLNYSSLGFNPFVSFALGTYPNSVDQTFIRNPKNWMVCHFDNWAIQKFPMGLMADADLFGPGHVAITTKLPYWKLFNVTTIALHPPGLEFLIEMKSIAETYSMKRGWARVGYYFHCLPHCSVNSLCLHVVNLDTANNILYKNHYRNLPIDNVISVMMVLSALNSSAKKLLLRRTSIIFTRKRISSPN